MENDVIAIDIEKMMVTNTGNVKLAIKTSIQMGELVALFGASGVGKTTLLRILAGLVCPDKGFIRFGNTVWFDSYKNINVPPQLRNLSLMFQDYALFPSMTVEQNIRFAQPEKDEEAIHNLLTVFDLTEFRKLNTSRLSGGQKQRVALARALARKPKLLLLDEPLSSLDASMRSSLQKYIMQAHHTLGATTIMVSHDVSEVFALATQVLCLQDGLIYKKGTPHEVFSNNSISGKVQIVGQIVLFEKQDNAYIVTVATANNQLIKVVAFESDRSLLQIGDQVLVYAKAFNPIICKIEG